MLTYVNGYTTMTVFDSIRFHNIDIFNEDELRQLPRPLLEAWIGNCLIGVDYPHELNLSDPRNCFGVIIFNIIVLRSKAYSFGISSTEAALSKIYTREYSLLLRKMLGEYDT